MAKKQSSRSTKPKKKPICGLVMPISDIDGCTAEHWARVRGIIEESLASDFEVQMVSDAPDSGVIQSDIVQNLATNPVVVCDVSGRNPNVMVELGLRLAIGMPVVIIKDDKTPRVFDVDPLRYVPYRRDLRYDAISDFKRELKDRVRGSIRRAEEDPKYSAFMDAFGPIKVARVDRLEAGVWELISDRLVRIEHRIATAASRDDLAVEDPSSVSVQSTETLTAVEKDELFETLRRLCDGLNEVSGRHVLQSCFRLFNKRLSRVYANSLYDEYLESTT